MLKRTITALVLLALIIPLAAIPVLLPGLYILFGIFAIISTIEFLQIRKKDKPFKKGYYIVLPILTSLVYFGALNLYEPLNIFGYQFGIKYFILFTLIAVLVLLSLLVFDEDFDAKRLGYSLLAVLYPAMGMGAMMVLRSINRSMFAYLFAIALFTDTFALFYGLLFGKHKLTHISPKKTWEGAVGGSIVATTAGFLCAYFFGKLFGYGDFTIFDPIGNFSDLQEWAKIILIIIITLVGTIISQIGDLAASKIKRTYDVKDFGNVFPGHGGIMDRFDSTSLVAIYILIFLMILGGM